MKFHYFHKKLLRIKKSIFLCWAHTKYSRKKNSEGIFGNIHVVSPYFSRKISMCWSLKLYLKCAKFLTDMQTELYIFFLFTMKINLQKDKGRFLNINFKRHSQYLMTKWKIQSFNENRKKFNSHYQNSGLLFLNIRKQKKN